VGRGGRRAVGVIRRGLFLWRSVSIWREYEE
jgi:hypothetical protein